MGQMNLPDSPRREPLAGLDVPSTAFAWPAGRRLTSAWAPVPLMELERDSTMAGAADEVEISLPAPDQSWFWTPEWQQAEREADKDIREGNVLTFDNVHDLIEHLHK